MIRSYTVRLTVPSLSIIEPGYRPRIVHAADISELEPDNTGYARDLAVSYERLGDLALHSGQGELARQLFQQSLAIRERLAGAEPDNTGYARDLAVIYERLDE